MIACMNFNKYISRALGCVRGLNFIPWSRVRLGSRVAIAARTVFPAAFPRLRRHVPRGDAVGNEAF